MEKPRTALGEGSFAVAEFRKLQNDLDHERQVRRNLEREVSRLKAQLIDQRSSSTRSS